MDLKEIAEYIFRATVRQNAEEMNQYFTETSLIYWHNTNECFSLTEYIRANCEYPGNWKGFVERIEQTGNLVILVGAVHSADSDIAFHVTSFYKFAGEKVTQLDEYWGDDGKAPEWRLDMKIGRPIKHD